MIDKQDFKDILKDLRASEEERETIITRSREIIKISKLIIYAIHRDDLENASKHIETIKDKVKQLPSSTNSTGMLHVAFQEYVEALAFFEFVKHKKLPTRKQLNVKTEEYLLGLCDLTGELVRKAVNDVINEDFKSAIEIKDFVEAIYGEFLKFDLRNSELRRKYDSIKWALKKLEDIAYDISLRR